MKFGVYSYSLYENADDARNEAQTLYSRAPKASFYVNDFEQIQSLLVMLTLLQKLGLMK